MGHGSKKEARRGATASALLIALAVFAWAVSRKAESARASLFKGGTAHGSPPSRSSDDPSSSFGRAAKAAARPAGATRSLPSFARFREVSGRGLIVKVWIDGAGPFDFAVDTGAGSTILSTRVAQAARVSVAADRAVDISGLSGARRANAREASVRSIAVGAANNLLPGRGSIIVADALPPDLDGVLDPSETFYPLGYVIDFRAGVIRAFDPRTAPLRRDEAPPGGDTVAWLTEGGTRRPFVALEGGRRALVDTGSGLGLGLTPEAARALGVVGGGGRVREGGVRDLGRGQVQARRIEPATVRIGALVLRRVPTDLLAGASAGAPAILGRDALRPFELTFDPLNRLIRFAPYPRS
jgi:hypothetical protein